MKNMKIIGLLQVVLLSSLPLFSAEVIGIDGRVSSNGVAFNSEFSQKALADILPPPQGISAVRKIAAPELDRELPVKSAGKHYAPDFDHNPGHHDGGQRNQVYCDTHRTDYGFAYAIYRRIDNLDLANALWLRDKSDECYAAADVANESKSDLVCARYIYRSGVAYSIYRISDNKDLGSAVISDFNECQKAVINARDGVFCSTYYQNGKTWWSGYEVVSGKHIGAMIYGTLNGCLNAWGY